MTAEPVEKLFVYGTLREGHVQRAIIGRVVTGRAARLRGFRLGVLRQGEASYPILSPDAEADVIDGEILELRPQDLPALDEYEGREYQRIRVAVESGEDCWVYVEAK